MDAIIEDRAIDAVCCSGQGAGTGLKELTIIPWGHVKSKRGDFVLDDEASRLIVSAFDAHAVSLPIDWEHETLTAKGRADAAGWIERLWAVPGVGLKALVKWTDKAREAIKSDAYRYLSPVLLIRKEDKRAVELHSAGLTNVPAIPAMERMAASTRVTQEELTTMANDDTEARAQLEKLRELLGLDDAASITDVLKAAVAKIEALTGEDEDGDKEVASSVRSMLGLPSDAPKAAVILAMKIGDASGAMSELIEMRAAEADRVAQEHVDRHVKALKINANDVATMAAALELAKAQPELLDRIMANAASVMPEQGRTTPPPGPGSRNYTIQTAVKDYDGDEAMQKTCSMKAAVNLALRETGKAELSESEEREYVTV